MPGVSNALLTVSKADPALNVLISDVGYDGVFNINVALTGVDAIGLMVMWLSLLIIKITL